MIEFLPEKIRGPLNFTLRSALGAGMLLESNQITPPNTFAQELPDSAHELVLNPGQLDELQTLPEGIIIPQDNEIIPEDETPVESLAEPVVEEVPTEVDIVPVEEEPVVIPESIPEPTIIPTSTPTLEPQPTLRPTPEATPVPRSSLEFKFGNDISAADQQLIRNAASWTQKYWGEKAGPVTVYSFSNLEALLDSFGKDCACPHWTSLWNNIKYELQLPGHWSTTAPGALLIYASRSNNWQKDIELLPHNHFHAIQRTKTGGNVDPVWIAEGSAEFAMVKVQAANGRANFTSGLRYIIGETKSMSNLSLSDLETRSFQGHKRAPYAIGFLAMEYISSKYGEQSILDYWIKYGEILQKGGIWQQAFELTYGIPVARFYSDFAAYRARL